MAMPKQRLYIDESGDHTVRAVTQSQWDKRYLCLLGCALDFDYCRDTFQAAFEALKRRHFAHDLDEPVILHREDLVAKRGPFKVLHDPAINKAFCEDLLGFIADTKMTAYAVVIDKLAIQTRYYGPISSHPYHIGLLAMLERYCGSLSFSRKTGDVLAEARGGREDQLLKSAYMSIYTGGTSYRPGEFFQKTLTSREIKIKPKMQNIPALQLADLLAHPIKRRILEECGISPPATGFAKEMADVVEAKFNRRYANGQVKGYGKFAYFK